MSADRKILAIDTTWSACSVAVSGFDRSTPGSAAVDGHSVWRHEAMTKGQAERLFPMVQEVMAEAALTFHDLDAIAVTIGPGSFTGVRVGIAAARGLALATQLPTFGATSLAPLARLAIGQFNENRHASQLVAKVTVLQDAKRGNVFVQDFDAEGRTPINQAQIVPASEVPSLIAPSSDQVLTGTAVESLCEARLEAKLSAITVEVTENMPTALALTEVDLVEMKPIKPLYLRPADAKAQTGKSLLRQSK